MRLSPQRNLLSLLPHRLTLRSLRLRLRLQLTWTQTHRPSLHLLWLLQLRLRMTGTMQYLPRQLQ